MVKVMNFSPRLMAAHQAPVPHRDPEKICRIILENFPEAPCIPRLSQGTRMFLEGMPCVVVDSEKKRLWFDLSPEREGELLEFYERYLAQDVDCFAISPKWGSGLYTLLEMLQKTPPEELKLVRIAIPGPISWALTSTDEKGVPALYNETMLDILVKTLAMKAKWQERKVKEALPGVQTMVELGEPALLVHTSAVGSGVREDIIKAINEVLEAVEGLTEIHCCANIDWSILMDTNVESINFDAYEYADRVALYSEDLSRFLERGGMLSWGIVPTSNDKIVNESVEGLQQRLEKGIDLMVAKGINREKLLERSWVTPSCATSNMSIELAERAFAFTSEISRSLRAKYFG